jgi:hypothetical protein
VDTGESVLLSKHLGELTAAGKRKLLLNVVNLSRNDSIIAEIHVARKRCGGKLKVLSTGGRVLMC